MTIKDSFLEGVGRGVGHTVVWIPVLSLLSWATGISVEDVALAFGRGFAAVLHACNVT